MSKSQSKSHDLQNYALECLRLAAQCRGLAQDVSTADQKAHFLRMAGEWEKLAAKPFHSGPTLH